MNLSGHHDLFFSGEVVIVVGNLPAFIVKLGSLKNFVNFIAADMDADDVQRWNAMRAVLGDGEDEFTKAFHQALLEVLKANGKL